MNDYKIWKGRIEKDTDLIAAGFTASIDIDRNLYSQDITATAAYAAGLKNIGVLDSAELKKIFSGLKEVKKKIEAGKVKYEDYEDIHSLVENELTRIAGAAAEKIHTGRSRNDQIVVDELLFLKESIIETGRSLILLEKTIMDAANKSHEVIFPAYTHMQKAQPVLFSHYLLSYFDKFSRNMMKLLELFDASDFLPLGSAACAGSGYPIDQKLVAELLRFARIGTNSIDIVGNRDFIIDYVYCCTMIMLNLSRFCEDLIIYNSQEFSFIDIDDSFCTGSSIMPQKKNPDILELIRGKSAVVSGNLSQIINLLKGLPSAYNSDLQEDKKIMFNAKNETLRSIEVFTRILENIKLNKKRIKETLNHGYIEATDIADYLVKKGQPFRKAHNIVGRLVRYCIENKLPFKDLPLDKLKEYSAHFDMNFYNIVDIQSCVDTKETECGTSVRTVLNNISRNKKILAEYEKKLELLSKKIPCLDDIISL